MTKRNNKRYSKAWAISDRSGFKFPMSEMVDEDGFLVHKSEADGDYSLKKHPLSNMSRYLKGKTGDPFSVPNARPDRNWHEPMVFQGAASLGGVGDINRAFGIRQSSGNAILNGTGTIQVVSSVFKNGASSISATGSITAVGKGNYKASSALQGVGQLFAMGQDIEYGSTTLNGTGTLTAAATVVASTTVNYSIAATGDDGYSNADLFAGTDWYNLSGGSPSYIPLGVNPFDYSPYAGFRFTSVNVPNGSTIMSATLTLMQKYTAGGTPCPSGISGTWWAWAKDDAPQYDTTDNPNTIRGIGVESETTATGTFNASLGTSFTSVDHNVTSIVQEIVNRAGWSALNDINFMGTINPNIGGTYTDKIEIHDYTSPSATVATLEIEYV